MKITHKYWANDSIHEIEFEEKDIIQKNGIRKEEVNSRVVGLEILYTYKDIPVVRNYIKCPICFVELQIAEIDKI